MSRLLAVAARELRERWLLFPGAFVAGFLPLVLPAFGVERELVPTVGVTGAALLGAAAAVVIGSSMLARDAANGRLGFLFSRPLSWGTIWGGKWLAAIALAAASAFLCAIPWMAAYPLSSLGGHHGDSWLRAMLDGPGTLLGFVVIVLIVGLANFGSTLFRSRSPWLALDLVLLLAATWATWRCVAPLWFYGILGLRPVFPASTLLLLPLALALLVGSVVQVAVGRTDLHRAHRALSLGFWAVTFGTLVVAAGYWQWVRSTGPDAVSVHAVTRDAAGRWIYVEGSGQHSGWYPHGFLIDTTTGRYLARPGPDQELAHVGFRMVFSADGRFGALPGPDRDNRGAALRLFDLTGEAPRLKEVALESSPPPTWKTVFALSPTAASIFVVHESGASFYELPSGRRIATTTIPPGWRPAVARYLAEGAARAWLVPSDDGPARRTRAEMRVLDLAKDGASSATTFPVGAAVDPVVGWRLVLPDALGGRILTSEAGLHLRDGATGAPLASLVEGIANIPALFLADGRIVVGRPDAQPSSAHPRLSVFDRGGTKLADFELPLLRPGSLRLGPEVAPGRVMVSSYRGWLLSEDALTVDVASGGVVDKLLPGLRPVPGASSAAPGAGSSVHFFNVDEERGGADPGRHLNRVVRIDFATGERKVVAGAGAPRGERLSAR